MKACDNRVRHLGDGFERGVGPTKDQSDTPQECAQAARRLAGSHFRETGLGDGYEA
jgi:hypothetical protein